MMPDQLEKPESSYEKIWGPTSTLGWTRSPAMPLFQPERTRDTRKPPEYCGYGRRGRGDLRTDQDGDLDRLLGYQVYYPWSLSNAGL